MLTDICLSSINSARDRFECVFKLRALHYAVSSCFTSASTFRYTEHFDKYPHLRKVISCLTYSRGSPTCRYEQIHSSDVRLATASLETEPGRLAERPSFFVVCVEKVEEVFIGVMSFTMLG